MTVGFRELVGAELASAQLFVDFDGTLSPIVEDPASARPLPGLVDQLVQLVGEGCTVTVLSGRPASFLAAHLPTDIEMVGLYGLERVERGSVVVDEGLADWSIAVDEAAAAASRELPAGVSVEHKGLSLTVHYRSAPDLADRVRDWADSNAGVGGLVARPAKQSVELHPPVDVDKGVALLARIDPTTTWAVFIGDDAGDLPAFEALGGLQAAGMSVHRVVVAGPETPPQLLEVADLTVEGPGGVARFLGA